jgi:hypothetical protein
MTKGHSGCLQVYFRIQRRDKPVHEERKFLLPVSFLSLYQVQLACPSWLKPSRLPHLAVCFLSL